MRVASETTQIDAMAGNREDPTVGRAARAAYALTAVFSSNTDAAEDRSSCSVYPNTFGGGHRSGSDWPELKIP